MANPKTQNGIERAIDKPPRAGQPATVGALPRSANMRER